MTATTHRWIAERVGALIEHADIDGVERMLAIAERLERVLRAETSRPRCDGGGNGLN